MPDPRRLQPADPSRLFGRQITLATPTVPIRALSIVGSYVGSLQELKDLIALVRADRINPIPIFRSDNLQQA